jgi:hypothetical protein
MLTMYAATAVHADHYRRADHHRGTPRRLSAPLTKLLQVRARRVTNLVQLAGVVEPIQAATASSSSSSSISPPAKAA